MFTCVCVFFVFRGFFDRPSQTNSIPLREHLRNVNAVYVIMYLCLKKASLLATSLCFITLLCSEALGLRQYKPAFYNAL